MDIVDTIVKAVLPKVLPGAAADSAESGLLSQFIAIFATKVAGSEGLSLDAASTGASIIQSVFPQAEERGELITKLSELHKVDEATTQTLLAKAAPLVTGELNTLSGGNSIQSFLGDHLSFLGDKLPSWATSLIPSSILGAIGAVGATAAAAAGKVGDIAGGAADLAKDAAGATVDAAGNVVGAAGDVAGATVDAAGDAVEAAGDLAKGAAGAAVGAAGAAVDAVGDVAGATVDAAGDAVEAAGDLAKGAAGAAVGAAGAAADAVGNVAGATVDAAGDAVEAAGDLAKGAAGAAVGAAGAAAATGGSLFKKLLPILGLIGLGLLALALWKSCAGNKGAAPVAGQITDTGNAATKTPASFNITTGEGDAVYACNGNVGDQGLKDKLVSAVKGIFGSEEACQDITVDDTYATELAGLDNMDKVLTELKAVPNASASLVNGKLIVNAPDEAAKATLIEKLKGLLPGIDVVPAGKLNIEQEVQQSVDSSLAALNALDEAANSRDIARALNLQIINFAVNKADIPEINKPVLNKAVEVMNKLPQTTLGITGHTDSDGDDAANQVLSEKRANSVQAYLTAQGVSAERLTTFGAGETKPVADNATNQGKFRNRRISFSAEKVGIIDAVTDVASATAGAAGAVAEGTVDAAATVVEAAGDVAEGTVDAVTTAGGAAVDAVADTGSAAVDAVAGAAEAVSETTTDSLEAATDALPDDLLADQ